MSDEKRTTTGEQPVTNGSLHLELLGFFRKQLGGNLVMAALAVGGATLGAWRAVAQEARSQADAGVAPVALRVEDLNRRVESVEKQVPEIQADIRALYKAVMTGRPQERLEHPAATDGGR
jgi:hypothetical protein